MSDLLKRIADYFTNEYDGDDKTAPKMELSVDELRYIASMHVERCRAESQLRELKNKKRSRTNADRIRSMTDTELADFLFKTDCCLAKTEYVNCSNQEGCGACGKVISAWLQSEVGD